jgi:dihydrofolate reductase
MGREQVSKVIYDMSMSLDGFVTAAEISPEEPLGIGGERLHEWAAPGTDPRGISLVEQSVQREGAIIVGRRTHDQSRPWWGTNGPTGETRTPVFVLTHRESPPPLDGGVYTFVTDGIDSVVEQAKAVAGDKNVGVSGVSVGQQLIDAGHVDEIWIHVVPVLFGSGTRLYEQAGGHHRQLDLVEAIPTPNATHLHYRLRK